MKRLHLLVVFGGESSEHDVSIASARNVVSAVDRSKYEVTLAYIDRAGRWWHLPEWLDDPTKHKNIQLVVAPGTAHLLTVPGSNIIKVDVIFPVLHGKMGEDGTIQGLAEMVHVPIVGCGVEASALCMNKDATKQLLAAHGIAVVPWISVRDGDTEKNTLKTLKNLNPNGPWFVKPSRAGSSFGVSKVNTLGEVWQAVEKALKFDATVLVETAVIGKELEVAVIGNAPDHKASGIGEIIPSNEFYDFEAKYDSSSATEIIINTKLPKSVVRAIRQASLDAYAVLGCSGLARIDFLLSDDLTPYVNEINTMPGFTNTSVYPMLWESKGMTQVEIVDTLIKLALD